jgi:GH24 family phage-related lysozyme (muramidase)
MRSGQHLKLPKSEQQAFEENLRLQAEMEGLKIDIKVKDNRDNTVDISWTVSEGTVPVTSTRAGSSGRGEGVTAVAPTAGPAPTAATSGSEHAPSAVGPSASAGPAPLRPPSPSATAGPAPTAATSGSAPSAARPSVFGRLSEGSEAGNRGAASISGATVSGASSGKVPDQAVQIVSDFEGFEDHVYDDGVGVATIGYGTTRYPDGRPVRFGDPNITKATAKIYLSHDLETTVNQLNSSIPHWNEMDDNQRSALISFAYNLGDHFYGSDKFTTITSALGEKRWDDVPKAMELYSNPNDPKVHRGLLRRRKDEGELWQGKGRFAK